MTIWGVLTTLHTTVATLLLKKSSTGPALSLHSSGKIFAEQPKITYSRRRMGLPSKIAGRRRKGLRRTLDVGHWTWDIGH